MSNGDSHSGNDTPLNAVALVGMAGRFPGARNIEEFWRNLSEGVESITFFSDDELLAAGIEPALLRNTNYVKANGILEDIDKFDAAFFGFNPKEAELTDPQHRLFFECAWEAFEDAGYDPEAYPGPIGVFTGVSISSYLLGNLIPNSELTELMGSEQVLLGNLGDSLPTRLAYKLNLKGPSLNIQTACSTSLVATSLACQSLISYQSDMAVAGAVSIRLPQRRGYLHVDGAMLSPDGHCRAFDADARGTIFSEGVGVVILKRLEDALNDGDQIYAIIRGTAINNDGSLRVGFTSPGVEGQVEVIATAHALAEVDAGTISYVETHGTATPVGDPIEIAALTKAFRLTSDKKGFCAIGSLKSNIGHLDVAAGVASLIKTALSLKFKQLPPTLHVHRPNPRIDFANSPFYVNTTLTEWVSEQGSRRAGVSAFGLGGTNAHAVLEEAPEVESSKTARKWHLLPISARSSSALEQARTNLGNHLSGHPHIDLADVAFTLQVGRKAFSHRQFVICSRNEDTVEALAEQLPGRLFRGMGVTRVPPVAFLFPGQGAQHVEMARELYQVEPLFREHVDYCVNFLQPHLAVDLCDVLYPDQPEGESAAKRLEQTCLAQPALFVIEYALAQLWMSWGVQPQAMLGHSIGEYVAATLSGVFRLDDALTLVAARGRLMQALPVGAMLAIPLPEVEVRSRLSPHLSVAAVNAPSLCVVSGPTEAVEELEQQLGATGVMCRRLHTSHAFHSQMMEPILQPFTELVKQIELNPPQIPFISNVTGSWITPEQATDPTYWATHLRQGVRFSTGLGELMKNPGSHLLEVGPGQTLAGLARQHAELGDGSRVISSMRQARSSQSDSGTLLIALGKLWLAGVQIDWKQLYAGERRRRISLPTYPFQRQRYWIDPPALQAQPTQRVVDHLAKRSDLTDWFYLPSWSREVSPRLLPSTLLSGRTSTWLIFIDECGIGTEVVDWLRRAGQKVTSVTPGQQFSAAGLHGYTLNPNDPTDYVRLLKEIEKSAQMPDKILHLWNVTSYTSVVDDHVESSAWNEQAQFMAFYSLLYLVQAMEKQNDSHTVDLLVVSTGSQEVLGGEVLCPAKATVNGLSRVIPQENLNVRCRNIDIEFPDTSQPASERLILQLVAEALTERAYPVVAYRGQYQWVQSFQPLRQEALTSNPVTLREHGVYLITGGLGGVGLQLANYLAETIKAKLILTGRSALPPRGQWPEWLKSHGEDDPVSRKVRAMQRLEEKGAEVLPISADAGNEEQMQSVIRIVLEHFGQLNGLIHAAGVASMTPISNSTPQSCQKELYPKTQGLVVLERVLSTLSLDFCVVTSSLSTVLGGLGYAAYASANSYMDAFVHQQNQKGGTPWLCIDWDDWNLEGELQEYSQAMQAGTAMTAKEGVETFARILSLEAGNHVVVSATDLYTRLKRWVTELPREAEATAPTAVQARQPRPSIESEYVAPRLELEAKIAGVWQSLLGIEPIGVYDNFFDLGGDSLLVMRLISRLRETVGVGLSMQDLFETPTVAGLANVLQTTLVAAQAMQMPAATRAGEREEVEI